MSAPPDSLLKVGADAMRDARYTDAIQAFETFCKGAIDRRSKPFFQAQMALVQAYKHTGQELHAIALCDQLVKSNVPQVQQWAQAARARLVESPNPTEARANAAPESASTAHEPTPEPAADLVAETQAASASDRPSFLQITTLLPPEEAAELFGQGRKAMQQGKFAEGIAALEAFVQGAEHSYSNFNWALTSLGKAYRHTEQFDKAMALQQALSQSEQESLRAWARDFFKTLPKPELPAEPEPEPAENPAAIAAAASADQGAAPYRAASKAASAPRTGVRQTDLRGKSGASRSAASSGSDLSPQILSALSHGSISLLADLLVGLIFMDSVVAQVLILLRFAVPVVIWVKAEDPVVKANAKECINYIISCLLVGLVVGIGIIISIPLMVVALPLVILLGIAVMIYGLVLTIWPIVATIVCARNSDRIFRYPNWLILHLL